MSGIVLEFRRPARRKSKAEVAFEAALEWITDTHAAVKARMAGAFTDIPGTRAQLEQAAETIEAYAEGVPSDAMWVRAQIYSYLIKAWEIECALSKEARVMSLRASGLDPSLFEDLTYLTE